MANSSELLHFLKSDRHITAFSLRAQDILAETVHNAFKFLVEFFQAELEMCMPGILSESEDDDQATQGIMKVHIHHLKVVFRLSVLGYFCPKL